MLQRKASIALATVLAMFFVGCALYEAPYPSPYRAEVRLDLFYDSLTPFGEWILSDVHGWVWVPAGVPVGWRPFTHGRWIYTSAGWTWYSDWDWGWAPFHYGRWFRHRHHGWVWIPGRVWGPGWVAWRSGDGWVGWAPLPPEVRWRVGVGVDLGAVNLELGIASDHWSLVPVAALGREDVRRHLVPLERHPALLRVTRDVTRYQEQDQIVRELGVALGPIEKARGEPIPRYRFEDLDRPPRGTDGRLERDSYRVYRPKVREPTPGRTPEAGRGKKRGGG